MSDEDVGLASVLGRWDPRRQREHVPVHMCVALVRSEAYQVEPLGLDGGADGTPHAVHDALELDVLVLREVADDVDAMLLRRDERVPADSRVAVEEGNRELVLNAYRDLRDSLRRKVRERLEPLISGGSHIH